MNLENIIIIGIVAFIAIVLIILLIVLLKKKSKIEIHRKRYMIDPIVKIDNKQYNELIKYGNSIKNNTSGKKSYGIIMIVTSCSFIIITSIIYWFNFKVLFDDGFTSNLFLLINEGNFIIGVVIPISIFLGFFVDVCIRRGIK